MSVASTRQRPELRPSRASRGGGPGEKLVQEEKDGLGAEGEEDFLGVQQARDTGEDCAHVGPAWWRGAQCRRRRQRLKVCL